MRAGGVAVFVLATIISYFQLYGVGFVTDFLGWMECHEQGTRFVDLNNCFSIKGLFFLPFAVLQILSDLFGYHPLPWYLTFAGLHGLNGWMVSVVAIKLGRLFGVSISAPVAIIAGLLFIFQPYQVEVVAWKACVNYLTACALMLGILYFYIDHTGNTKVEAADHRLRPFLPVHVYRGVFLCHTSCARPVVIGIAQVVP